MDGPKIENPILRRAFLFLEDADWERAEQYAEETLDGDPECAKAYMVKLLARRKAHSMDELAALAEDFSEDPDYQKIIRFGTDEENQPVLECLAQCQANMQRKSDELEAANLEKERKKQESRKALMKKLKIVLPHCAAAVTAVIVFITVIIPAITYQNAMTLRENGKWDEAIAVFRSLQNYKDAGSQISETKYLHAEALANSGDYQGAMDILYPMRKYSKIPDLLKANSGLRKYWFSSAGKLVSFGHYNIYTYTEFVDDIDWLVLSCDGSRSLLISKDILDVQPYEKTSELTEVPWSESFLRKWLNSEFFEAAFSDTERAAIAKTYIQQDSGKNTIPYAHDAVNGDRVFILSVKETEKYFKNQDEIYAQATQYAESKGLKNSWGTKRAVSWNSYGDHFSANYWLRTRTGVSDCLWQQYYCWTRSYGTQKSFSMFGDRDQKIGVRPAVWIDLNSAYFE